MIKVHKNPANWQDFYHKVNSVMPLDWQAGVETYIELFDPTKLSCVLVTV
jgi:hypothetical protein